MPDSGDGVFSVSVQQPVFFCFFLIKHDIVCLTHLLTVVRVVGALELLAQSPFWFLVLVLFASFCFLGDVLPNTISSAVFLPTDKSKI